MAKIAEAIVAMLIEGQRRIPIKLRLADGSVIDAEFNGYYDLSSIGRGHVPSIGKPFPGAKGMSHGMLGPGEKIETSIPSPEELSGGSDTPAKGCFWPTM